MRSGFYFRRSRRSVLRAAAGLPFLSSKAVRSETQLPSLKEAASSVGLLFGSDSDTDIVSAPAPYRTLFVQQCDLFAPLLSWQAVGRRRGIEPTWEDPNIAFARRNGIRLTGGHLLWYLRSPDWFAGLEAGAAAQAAVDQHITQMVTHYAGQVFSWNVVNEAIDPRQGGPFGLRRTIYDRKLGPDYMSAAFRTARAADPKALLVYNDADFEMDTSRDAARRDALMRLLDRLQRDAPIDGVGLQSHLRLSEARFDQELYRRFLHDIASRGLKILITELDVLDTQPNLDSASRDSNVANFYSKFLSVALDEQAVKAVVLWGLSDRYTWLAAERKPMFARAGGLPPRPLPFDVEFRPKPAFEAILNALRRAPRRVPA